MACFKEYLTEVNLGGQYPGVKQPQDSHDRPENKREACYFKILPYNMFIHDSNYRNEICLKILLIVCVYH
jgi:hypothetical protein